MSNKYYCCSVFFLGYCPYWVFFFLIRKLNTVSASRNMARIQIFALIKPIGSKLIVSLKFYAKRDLKFTRESVCIQNQIGNQPTSIKLYAEAVLPGLFYRILLQFAFVHLFICLVSIYSLISERISTKELLTCKLLFLPKKGTICCLLAK